MVDEGTGTGLKSRIARWWLYLLETGGAALHGIVPMFIPLVSGFVIAALFFGPTGPEWVSYEYWVGESKSTTRSEVFRNLALAFFAGVGVVFGAWRTFIARTNAKTDQKSAYLAEQGQVTDRYAKAVEMLGDKSIQTRIGGIYALSRIAKDSPERDFEPVMDTLCEFVRTPPDAIRVDTHSGASDIHSTDSVPEFVQHIKRQDVMVAIQTIAERKGDTKGAEYQVDFSGAQLKGLDLPGINVSGANLRAADLSGTNLRAASLECTDLSGANLNGADLRAATLRDANLNSAIISEAYLGATPFNLADAHLIMNARFEDLPGFFGAQHSDALNLKQQQIDIVRPSPEPKSLPKGIDWPFAEHGGEWLSRYAINMVLEEVNDESEKGED